jgi:hypothetical protein
MHTFRSLTTGGHALSRLAALAVAGLALSLALIVGSSPAHAAREPAAAPSRTTKAPPVISPHTTEALLSQLDSSLSKLGKRPTVQQLKALGLRPVPKRLAARFNKLAHSTRARAATAGSTFWFTQEYYGSIWVDEYYSGPYSSGPGLEVYYDVYNNFKVCNQNGGACYDANAYTRNFYAYLPSYGGWYWIATNGNALDSEPPFGDEGPFAG